MKTQKNNLRKWLVIGLGVLILWAVIMPLCLLTTTLTPSIEGSTAAEDKVKPVVYKAVEVKSEDEVSKSFYLGMDNQKNFISCGFSPIFPPVLPNGEVWTIEALEDGLVFSPPLTPPTPVTPIQTAPPSTPLPTIPSAPTLPPIPTADTPPDIVTLTPVPTDTPTPVPEP